MRKWLKPLLLLLGGMVLLGIIGYSLKVPYLYPYSRWLVVSLTEKTPEFLDNPLPNQRFTDTWHSPRGGGRKHEGSDIFAKRGTPIYANISGIVVKKGQNRLGGNIVSVLGVDGRVHYYAHLEDFGDIEKHQWIDKGTIIGTVGDSGNAKGTPPHLHYGIYTKTGAVNPFLLVKQQ
ncbi:M23 family metallopeptidase [Glaesserella sp.]|uniref:M23 family metallopeptidase n=1 Tax=Glaesserella sp. TaxID=2094731 RepID=UPI00359FB5C3